MPQKTNLLVRSYFSFAEKDLKSRCLIHTNDSPEENFGITCIKEMQCGTVLKVRHRKYFLYFLSNCSSALIFSIPIQLVLIVTFLLPINYSCILSFHSCCGLSLSGFKNVESRISHEIKT